MGVSGVSGPGNVVYQPSSPNETPAQQLADLISLINYWSAEASLTPPGPQPTQQQIHAAIAELKKLENKFPNFDTVKSAIQSTINFLGQGPSGLTLGAEQMLTSVSALQPSDFSTQDSAMMSFSLINRVINSPYFPSNVRMVLGQLESFLTPARFLSSNLSIV